MKLNFKDIAGDLVKEAASNFIEDTVDNFAKVDTPVINSEFLIEGPFIKTNSSTSTPASIEVIKTKEVAYNALKKMEGKNIFSLPSILTIGFFLLSTIYVDVDQALSSGAFTSRDAFKIFYLLAGGVVTLVARGSEGKTGVWTPKGLPGLHKEDFVDKDNNGIDDRYQ